TIERVVFTNSAQEFHGGRWVPLNSGRQVGAIGWDRQGGGGDATGRGRARRAGPAPSLAPAPPPLGRARARPGGGGSRGGAGGAGAGLGWGGRGGARCLAAPAFELDCPALTHHRLLLFTHPPEELDLRYAGVKRKLPPPAGSISLIPAGCPGGVYSSGCKDELHIFLEPGLVARVAADTFELDPARLTVPPLDGLHLPQLRAMMGAVNDELMADAPAGRAPAESLATVLPVHLIRNASAGRPPVGRSDGAPPPGKVRAVIAYIEEHIDASPTLEQMAAVAHLS